jgi:hypothetical protein
MKCLLATGCTRVQLPTHFLIQHCVTSAVDKVLLNDILNDVLLSRIPYFRATSTTNVMTFTAAPLTRRSSERELDGSKKRATSASGLDRKPGEGS